MFLKCILLQKVVFLKYKSRILHGYKIKEVIQYFLARSFLKAEGTNRRIPILSKTLRRRFWRRL